ncbi:MAG: hypothetical protein JWN27_782 [Candidatus Eremiobacteraeota bacterium]|nr:hypothetical protein [Candidatus Eremiobacteraeota bacterium]
MLGTKDIEIFFLCCLMLRQKVKVFEESVLPNTFRAALPLDKLKLRDTLIGFQIKQTPSIARAKRKRFDNLSRTQYLRKTKQYSNRVDYNVDLPDDLLERTRSRQSVRSGPALGYNGRASIRVGTAQELLNRR